MVYKADKVRLKKLLMEAISLLCKNGLPVQSAFRIEATIGITLSEDDVVLVSFREVVQPDGVIMSQVGSDDEVNDDAVAVMSENEEFGNMENEKKSEESQAAGKLSTSAMMRKSTAEELEENESWNHSEMDPGNPGQNASSVSDATTSQSALATTEAASYDSYSRANRSSLYGHVNRGNSRRPSNLEPAVQIKDEITEDEDCVYVKMEDNVDNGAAPTFESLSQDDSWLYQVYDEANAYGATGNDLRQFAERQNYSSEDMTQSAALQGNQPWSAASREIPRTSQSRRSSHMAGGGGGGGNHLGMRQILPGAPRNQDRKVARTLQSLCKSLTDQSYSNVPAGEPVFCHICGARLSSHATLVKHIKGTHLAMSTCQCDICGETFKWTMQLCRHRKRFHSNIPSE